MKAPYPYPETRGPIGLEGPPGPRGPMGPMGLEGPQGPMGLEGERGPRGPRGLMGPIGLEGDRGPAGKDGKDGKDADMTEVRMIAEVGSRSAVKEHEEKFNHDPFLVGTKKVSEAGMSDGMVMTYDGKNDRLHYTTLKQVASKVTKLAGRGLSLPSQSGNAGKFLTTDGTRSSWSTPSDTGITRIIQSVSTPTTAAAAASKDYVYLISSGTTLTMPTAIGNTNRYTLKNTDSSAVTINFTGGQTCDGSASLSILQNVSLDLISNGSNWFII